MSGARTTSASSSCSAMSARTRSSFASSRGQLTSATRGGAGSPCASCHEITGIAQDADPLDLALHHVARLEVERRRVGREAGDAGHGPGRDHVAGRVAERRVVAQDLRDRHAHAARVRRLAHLAVDAQLHREVVRVGDLVGRDDPRPERAERVDRLAEREDARAHLAPLDVAGGDVVEDDVAADVVGRLLGREPLPGLPDHDRELELVVELLGQVLRVDDGLVGPDDRVDVLEEDDPRRDLVRPVDLLRLLLVLAEVAGRVEELLRDDRRAKLASRRAGRARRSSSAPPSSKSSRIDGTSSTTISSPSRKPTRRRANVTSFTRAPRPVGAPRAGAGSGSAR